MSGQPQQTGAVPTVPARWQLFVSFADDDRAWVEGFLLPGLRAAGVRFRVESDFELGRPVSEQFAAAVESSDRILLVISPAFLADDSAQRLRLLAQQYGQEHSTWPVLPMVLHPVEKLPLSLSLLASLDATREDEWESCLERLLADLDRPWPAPGDLPKCPYPGMSPYTKEWSGSFYGREAEIDEVLQRLRLHPLLAVVGPSGSGKSSLLHAGVAPRLPEATFRVVDVRPGPRPYEALTTAVQEYGKPDDRTTVLIVDQLEELFTVAVQSSAGSPAQVEQFCAELVRLATTGGTQCLLAVRADYYPQLMTSPLWDVIRDHRLEVLPLTGDRLRDAITAPAAQVNVHLESALVHTIVHDAAGQPGSLPLIQETLVLLWGRLRRRYLPVSAYDALIMPSSAYGEPPRTGLQVALARRADTAMARLATEEERLVARRIFLRLVQLMDGRDDVRRQQRRHDLESADSSPETFDRVLQHLIDARLVTSTTDEGTSDSGAAAIDLAHEAIINGWPALRGWIAERRSAERVRRDLEAAAQAWVRLGQGSGGLLDDVELGAAQAWLEGPDANELGTSKDLRGLVAASRSALDAARTRKARIDRLFRVLTAVLAMLLVAVVVAGLYAVNQRNEAEDGRSLARSRELALAAERELPLELDRALLLSQEALKERRTSLAQEALLAALSANPRVIRVMHAPNNLHAVVVSRDGTWAVTAGLDGVVRRWDLEAGGSGEPIGTMDDPVLSIALSPDETTVAATSEDGQIAQWVVVTRERVGWTEPPDAEHVGDVRAAAYSPDGRWLVTGGEDGRVILWDADTGRPARLFTGHRDWVNAVAFVPPDGSRLVTAGGLTEHRPGDQRILIWDVATGELLAELPGHADAVRALGVSPDGTLLASAGAEGLVKVWSLPTGKPLHELPGHVDRVFGLAFSADGSRLASAGRDHSVRQWDPATGQAVGQPLVGHQDSVRGVAFAGEGRLLSVGNGTRLVLWDTGDAPRNRLGRLLADQSDNGFAAAVDRTGELLATADDTGRVFLHSTSDGAPVGVELDAGYPVSGLAFGPGSMLVTATYDGRLQTWDATTGQSRSGPVEIDEGSVVVEVSPDGRYVATGGDRSNVRIWDPSLTLLDTLNGHRLWVRDLAFRQSDGALVSVGTDGRAFLWTGLPEAHGARLTEQTNAMESVAISPDGETVATGNVGGQVVLWDITERDAPQAGRSTQSGHQGDVTDVAYLSGRTLITADEVGTPRLWRVGELTPLGGMGSLGAISAIAVVPDREVLFSVGHGGAAAWNLDEERWDELACSVAGRNLTDLEADQYEFDETPRTCPDRPDG